MEKNVKKSKILTLILLVLVFCACVTLAGCDLLGVGGHTHNYSSIWSSDESYHWHACSGCTTKKDYGQHTFGKWVTYQEATESNPGRKYQECTICGYTVEEIIPQLTPGQQPSTPENPNPPTPGEQKTGAVDLYAINDFHGEHAKLAQIAGYISGRLGENNTVAINSGDMFQGSIQSNSNYGRLFTQCMNIAGFDAFTYGNHEFDWGLDNLRSLATNSTTPFLGANIYNWNPTAKTWGSFADDLAQEYVIKELDNGLRVGIIGVIGKDQITSISSQLVQTIGFKDPAEIIPGLSNKLRNQLDCDVIVVSAHTGQATFIEDTSWDITQYADVVFCAHTHQAETYEKNGVPFIQGGSNGNYVSHVKLYVEDNGNVRCDGYSNVSYYSLNDVNSYVKEQVQMNIDNSNARIEEEANEVLATISGGYLNRYTSLPRLVCHAIANYVTSQNIEIDLAICNEGRANLNQGPVTYTDLYKALPFDNVIYIARVTGQQIYNEIVNYDQLMWRVSGKAIENSSSKYYTIAVIDYLLFHQNTNRNYNYFSSAFYSDNPLTPYAVTKVGVDLYHYRLITRDFMKAQGTIDASLYIYLNNHTDSSLLTQAVTF